MEFKDSKGRVYAPRVTCRVIQRWEQATGRGLFQVVFDALIKLAETQRTGGTGKLSQQDLFEVARTLFGHLGNSLFLLYEACRPTANQPAVATIIHDDGTGFPRVREVEVLYDDFLDSIPPDQLMPSLVAIITALMEWFPEVAPANPTSPSVAEGPPPSVRSPGKTF